ncbi:unnamed protein product [Rotaria sordida]|uniref:G-protein coupled receptors family 1 profile domain-containing protein n=1 Tax=Rotaria sordida TaxID=392033 RepID=A0A813W601_9BILA|nr:unnamed protein product [Rotaria sordida]
MIVAGILMYVFGIIGNILNICVFTKWCRSKKKPQYSYCCRTSNSSLYLLGSSIANLIVIIYPLSTRILLDGYKYHVKESNAFLLSMLNRYLISSREVRLRKLITTRKRAKLIILFLICLFGLHNIPIIKYYGVSKAGYCTISSSIYSYYYLYTFQILLHGIIPIIFLSVFGFLTLKQLRIISRRKNHYGMMNSDKQLSRMLLLLSLAIILSSIPYCIEQSYYVLFNRNDRYQTSYFFLYHVVCSILFYTNPVSSFYIYYISTRSFRIQIYQILCPRRNLHYVAFYQIKSVATTTISLHESIA